MIGMAIAMLAIAAHHQDNTLTAAEKRLGFVLLFDGTSLQSWHGWRRANVPRDWTVKEGEIVLAPGGDGGDLSTNDQFRNFDLRLEWNVAEGSNSGIIYRASESYDPCWITGPEMQILDNAHHPDGRNPKTSAGSAYALYAPSQNLCKPAGEWNSVEIIARGNHVEHWMNGVKIVEYEVGSPDWTERYQKSKFHAYPLYGRLEVGHIVLQDHGDAVKFRNIRIRRL